MGNYKFFQLPGRCAISIEKNCRFLIYSYNFKQLYLKYFNNCFKPEINNTRKTAIHLLHSNINFSLTVTY